MDASHSLRRLVVLLVVVLSGGCSGPPPVSKPVSKEVPLAIEGFDTVAYFGLEPGAPPVPGNPEFEYEWDEQRYRFANAGNLETFKKDPIHYAPRFGNYCAGALPLGIAWKADPRIWEVRDDRLYVFGALGARSSFDEDPQRVIPAAERNYTRWRKGEKLVPEEPLTPEARAFFTAIVENIDQIRNVLDHQPPAPEPTEEPAARP
jgi:YHS domain-containing protein